MDFVTLRSPVFYQGPALPSPTDANLLLVQRRRADSQCMATAANENQREPRGF